MSTRDLAQQTLATAFLELGEAAEFRAKVGGVLQPPVAGILLMPTTRDDIEAQWESNRVRKETLFDVQVAQVATVPVGSRFTLFGKTWEVSGEPHRDDRLGLVWTFGCKEVA